MTYRFPVARVAALGLGLLALAACSDSAVAPPDAGPGDASPAPDAQVTPAEAGIVDAGPPDVHRMGDDDGGAPQPFTLTFEARVGQERFACGSTYTGIGTSGAEATVGDARFFIHDVRLVRDGKVVPVVLARAAPWQSEQLALLDFEDKSGECVFGTAATNDVVRGTAPGRGFSGLRFRVGVPEGLNHVNAETAEAPLPNSKLAWDWTTGFIHFAAEMRSKKALTGADGGVSRAPSFFAHVGSAECAGTPADGGAPACNRKNRPEVELAGFDPATSKIVVDLKALFAGSDLDVNTPMTMPGCMSSPTDPECGPLFARLGLDASGAPSATTPQTVFSAAPR